MIKTDNLPKRPDSPLHVGERAIQAHLGVEQDMDQLARRIIRSYMPQQHRDFYQQLPFIVLGGIDDNQDIWASLRFGKPGFITTPNDKTILIKHHALMGDPLENALQTDRPVGMLGIELHTRRRNRLTTRLISKNDTHISLQVDQSFGNCPQYIQLRDYEFVRDPAVSTTNNDVVHFNQFSDEDFQHISSADTFFVASVAPVSDNQITQGADVSHRGGRAGFVKVDGNTLLIPDYAGNNLYNTLGNFLLNPKAGLCFPDFNTGDLLLLTGSVEILWEKDPLISAFKGAERAWKFTLNKGVRLKNSMPLRWEFRQYSPNSLLAGDWQRATELLKQQQNKQGQRAFQITKIAQETPDIRSYYLTPNDGLGLPNYHPGQYLSVEITSPMYKKTRRTYTLSSTPHDPYLRITVKAKSGGASGWLHQNWHIGQTINALIPSGKFYLPAEQQQPLILLAAGVGITPMISMFKQVFTENFRLRTTRLVTLFYAARSEQDLAFHQELTELAEASNGALRYLPFVSQSNANPANNITAGMRIDADIFRQVLHQDNYQAYLCGPADFMQHMYDSLREVGVSDSQIHAESFGPSSLKRDNSTAPPGETNESDEAEVADIEFIESSKTLHWNKGDATLLEIAENSGLSPDFSCRSGSCGRCATRITQGKVHYRTAISARVEDDQVLLCCAVPAKDTQTIKLAL
ncbi:2Fe-2S iron-sulfur cluster-binding protein [Neptunicella marina]|uniref:2Fe-2S iron-sulfur cluster binding domain-containing protein n=1 Tax=Neptunicella marina TaxID=2125989 RepID=A0A8J6IPL0_9ALTE|nr:2Fe-2S iron-sulfur cluster-binding protein [Neptunicella marina]MBC3765535.1 2Fe-2S iron-sulfur cluster binding domain-containing protein [Neptunicella marina]